MSGEPAARDLCSGLPVQFEARLVEAAVLLRVRDIPLPEQASFRDERDRIYDIPDADERDAAFGRLHRRWFRRLDLDAPFHQALAEQPRLQGTAGCQVHPARTRAQEIADLLVPSSAAGPAGRARRLLVLRVRPEALLAPERLLLFLRRELLHVADMLDPEFGYDPDLPASDLGPSFDNLVRARYRILWDATVDGRLRAAGAAGDDLWEARHAEFARAFRMLGERAEGAFRAWFDGPRPAHADILAFARNPRSGGDRTSGS